MRTKLVVSIAVLVVIACVSFGIGNAVAENKEPIAPAKVGVISWRTVLNTCEKSIEMDKKFSEDRKKINEEMTQLKDEVVSLEIELKTSTAGGDDYMDKMRELVQKKAVVDAKAEFYSQELALKEQRGAEDVFQELVKATEEVAKMRGIDLVLAKDENQFPAANPSELMLTIRTSKVYYSSDRLDITTDVVAYMNANK